MFRPMRRINQQISDEECKAILREEKRAAFSVIGENGYPYSVPINFFYNECDNCIYIHGAKEGHKADAIRQCNKVCMTVWNQGFKKAGHWEWNVTSVVVFGRAKAVDDKAIQMENLRQLASKYYPTAKEIEKELHSPSIQQVQMLAVEIDYMTGKTVNEK